MNSKVRHIIYGIISFVLSFVLFLISFAIVLQSTILNPSYIMDNMNTMDFNQKIDVSLRASLEATPVERNASDDLSTGSSSDGFWNLIVLYTGSPQTLQNEFPSSSFTFLLGNYAIVKISEDDIPSLAAFPQVIYIERPRQLFFEIVSARQASCLSAIQENSSYGLTGKGILISVIDSGIDYAHPDFCNPDKTTRLVALWDQTILADPSAGRFAPAGYSQGTLFSPEQINAALQADTFEQRMELVPSTDVTGHGTHVAGIATGNGRASGGLYRGVAPESSLLAVKLGSPDPKGFPNTIELMQAVDFSVRYAIEHTVPLVINLSFGNTYGSHSGTSLLETYLDYVSNLGRINIVVGSGNEGNNGGHASARLASLESARIEFAVGNYESSLSIQIWKNYWDDIRFQLTPPGLGTSFKIPNQPGSWRFSFGTTQILVYYGLPSPYSLYQEIAIDLLPRRDYISGGVWFFTAEARSVIEGIIDLWMPAAAIRGTATQFLTPTTETTLTIPSTAGNVITVGAYDSSTNTLAPFSGRGYTWNTGQVKPDLVAPGVDITSCAVGGGYESRSGTSMAAPFVSGSCALLMQWGILQNNDPFLYGEKMKAYLIRGARQLPFSVSYPNPQSGYGALCVSNSLTFV